MNDIDSGELSIYFDNLELRTTSFLARMDSSFYWRNIIILKELKDYDIQFGFTI